MKSKKITLLGASGLTGNLIGQMLDDHHFEFQMAGRNIEKLKDLKTKWSSCTSLMEVDLNDEAAIKNCLESSDFIINAVGPFSLYSRKLMMLLPFYPLVYIDITGEISFVMDSYENYKKATNPLATIVHSCSFESALVDVMAKEFCNHDVEYDFMNSFYHFSKATPSPGTRLTMQIYKFFPQYILQNNELVLLCNQSNQNKIIDFKMSENSYIDSALIASYPEVFFLHQKYNVKNCASHILTNRVQAEFSLNTEMESEKNLDQILEKEKRRKITPMSEDDRRTHEYKIIFQYQKKGDEVKTHQLCGHDMYLYTANIVFSALRNLIKSPFDPGILSPSEVLNSDILQWR